MRQKRVVTIQDISCFGKCSLTVALPIISAMGVETAIIPTAVLSTHTGGFEGFTFRDLTDDIPKISKHWKKLGLDFDVIYTGYLGSIEQIECMKNFFSDFKTDNNIIIVDPAMGDNGRLYSGFTNEFATEMSKLCEKADIIVPNLTEAAFMLGEEYVGENYDRAYVRGLLKRLAALGCGKVIVTGINYGDGKIGAMSYSEKENEYYSYFTEHVNKMFHGTGDIFASVCAGAIAQGADIKKAMRLAVDFVFECIKATQGYEKEHWYGVRFEDCIGCLTANQLRKKGLLDE